MHLRTLQGSMLEEVLLMPSLHTAGGRRSMHSGHSCLTMTLLTHISMVWLLSVWTELQGDFTPEYSHILRIILRSE